MISWLVNKGVFRNANHAIWFLCSTGFFLVLLAIHLEVAWTAIVLAVALIVHIPPLVTSAYTVYRRRPSDIYSPDCIWFNGGMLLLYIFLLFA